MRKSWYVVEVYCLLSVLHVMQSIHPANENIYGLSILFGYIMFVFITAWFTFHGNRIASRLLAVFIALNAVYFVVLKEVQAPGFDVYRAYSMFIQIYLFVGAIKLWRIKELPTRFTDPPADTQSHA